MKVREPRSSVWSWAAVLLLAGCGGEGSEPISASQVTVVSVGAASLAATPAPAPTPTLTPVATAAQAGPAQLLPLDMVGFGLWNWDATWFGSEWANGFSPIPWKNDRIKTQPGGNVTLTLDNAGAPELKGQNGMSFHTAGLWEADVTLPQLRDGLVVAPLWLYEGGSADEIDFELAGRNGLDVAMHTGGKRVAWAKLFAGQDLSGRRMRLGIKMDQTAGYVEMYVDGKLVHRFDRTTPMVSHGLKPIISMWAADPNNSGFVGWAGKWAGLEGREALTMTVHGYAYTPLA